MVYLGILFITIGLVPLSEFVDDLFYFLAHNDYGYYYMDDLITGLVFLLLGLFLIIKFWKKSHRAFCIVKYIGIFFMIVGVLSLINSDLELNDFYFITFPGRFLASCRYFILGLLLYLYNNPNLKFNNIKKKSKNKMVSKTETTNQPIRRSTEEYHKKYNEIDLLIRKLKLMIQTTTAQENIEFKNNLIQSIYWLEEINKENYELDPALIDQLINLSRYYLDLEDNEVKSEKNNQTLKSIMETFASVREALENFYDRNFEETANSIDLEIVALKTKLNLKGLLDTPFEKKKQN